MREKIAEILKPYFSDDEIGIKHHLYLADKILSLIRENLPKIGTRFSPSFKAGCEWYRDLVKEMLK